MTNRLTACVLVGHLLATVALARRGAGSLPPLVVATGCSDRATVIDLCGRAEQRGVRVGMPVLQAYRHCRTLEVATVDRAAVEEAAGRIGSVLRTYADDVRIVGTGRWTLTLHALGSDFRNATTVARQLHHAMTTTGFPCTVGLGTNAAIACIAADITSTAVSVVLPGSEQTFLAPRSVRLLPGVGQRVEERLQGLGVTSIGQLAQIPLDILLQICGSRGRTLALLARGLDTGDERTTSPTVSSAWHATQEPCADAWRLLANIQRLSEHVGQTLRGQRQAAGRLTVQVTWTDRAVRQRTIHFESRQDLDRELATASREAIRALLRERRLAVLQLAVVAGDLGPIQQGLFAADDSRRRRLQQAIDTVKHRFGPGAIQAGALVGIA